MDAEKDMRRKISFHTDRAYSDRSKVIRRNQQNTEWTTNSHLSRALRHSRIPFVSVLPPVICDKRVCTVFHSIMLEEQSRCWPSVFLSKLFDVRFPELLSMFVSHIVRRTDLWRTARKKNARRFCFTTTVSHHWSFFFVVSRGRRASFRCQAFTHVVFY